MIKRIFIGVVVGLLMLVHSNAKASLQAGDTIRFLDGPGNPGGEFGVALAGTSTPVLFSTFCIERNEFLDFNSNGFVIQSISSGAISGGQSGGNPDPISGETAWLFLNFHNGTLLDYVSNATRANQLQNALWKFEGEDNNISATDIANNAADAKYYNLALNASAQEKADALSRVRVLNITWATSRSGYAAGTQAQDVLYVIPEPATLLVWSGLACLGWAGYRRTRSPQLAPRSA